MKCKFCDSECPEDRYWSECGNHFPYSIEYCIDYNGELEKMTIRSEKYVAHTYYKNLHLTGQIKFNLFTVPVGYGKYDWLLALKVDPELTPENFAHRIKTMLVFS